MLDLARQDGNDYVGDLIFDGKNVVEVPVVMLGPKALTGRRVDEPCG